MQALRKEPPLRKSVLATTPSKGPPVPKSLLREPSEVSFPKDLAPNDLANDLGNFCMKKSDKIIQSVNWYAELFGEIKSQKQVVCWF